MRVGLCELGRALLTALVAPLLACSHLTQVSAGPAATFERNDRAAWGGSVTAEAVTGATSPRDAFTGVGLGARGTVTKRVGDLAPFVSVHVGSSFDRMFLDGSFRFGPGVQITDGPVVGLASLGTSLGLGFAISDSGWKQQAGWFNPWGIEGQPERVPLGGPDVLALDQADAARRRAERERSRVLLTCTLAADVDARFTRSPVLALSLLAGVAWLDEVSHPQ